MVQAIIAWRSHAPLATLWDESGIHGSIAPGKEISIEWSEVSAIVARMYTLEIHLRNRTSVPVDLSQLTYKQQTELKPRILNLARVNGVKVRAA